MTADGPNDRHDPNDAGETNERHEHEMDGTNDMDQTDEPTDRLAVLLAAASDAADDAHGAPVADADDLGRRIRVRAARRIRVAGIAAAVLLVTAGAGGFALGRSAGDAGPGGGDMVAAGGDAGGGSTATEDAAMSERAQPPVGENDSSATPTTLADPSPSSGQPAMSYERDLPAEPLFTRTLADGTVLDVRVYRYPDQQAPADAACLPTGDLYVGVRAPDAVGQTYGQFHSAIAPGVLMVSVTTIGVPEGAPRWVIVAQGADDVATIRATFPDGSTDSSGVREGTGALASRSNAPFLRDAVRSDEVVVEGLDASGAVVARWAGDRWGGRSLPGGSDDVTVDPVPTDGGVVPETTVPAPSGAEPAPDDPATMPLPIEPADDVVDVAPGYPGSGFTSACPAP
jgi:hypothetical protein